MGAPRIIGKVARLMPDKGFGFIRGEDGGEYFFHRSAAPGVWESLDASTSVSFLPREGPKGLRAEEVRLE